MRRSLREVLSAAAVAALVLVATIQVPAEAVVAEPPRTATARGFGGAVSSVDPYATQIGLEVRRYGG
jgi:gamma-glutamyltranspeptidase / glutathione hydrolase